MKLATQIEHIELFFLPPQVHSLNIHSGETKKKNAVPKQCFKARHLNNSSRGKAGLCQIVKPLPQLP